MTRNHTTFALLTHLFLLPSLLAVEFFVAPDGQDTGPGTRTRPFRSLVRARDAVREALPTATEDVVVGLREGSYRLDQTLELGDQDSGREDVAVVWRSTDGIGKARLLGSLPLRGWKRHTDRVWKLPLEGGLTCQTLYEGGRRLHKARFPNYEHDEALPCARRRYLASESGSPLLQKGDRRSWVVYRPQDELPPDAAAGQMKINVFPWGKCDWHRWTCQITAIDRESRRIEFDNLGDGTQILGLSRFFLEDDVAFLDAPGEFFLDGEAHVLYCVPLGPGHPDNLDITAPVLRTLVRIRGADRENSVRCVRFEGLSFEETDAVSPTLHWWTHQWGRQDHALLWMTHAESIEVTNCRFRNSGRNGILMVGHNVGNSVQGCWIEQMGVNGITLSNRFGASGGKGPTADRLEDNVLCNNRIHDVGQLCIYAACINLMNGSDNEISHSELFNSPRYATTMRGNTNAQKGEPAWHGGVPSAKGNRFHHLRVHHCGQDSGDMGAIHTATLNIPGGDSINHFEQITITDSRAVASMHDIPPDGIFLDWPQRSMHQVFRHVQILRPQGRQFRTNGPDNATSATTENVSWQPDFAEEGMQYDTIGVKPSFPPEFGGPRQRLARPGPPTELRAQAVGVDTVDIHWHPPPDTTFVESPIYVLYRDDTPLHTGPETHHTDHSVAERTTYRYQVAVRDGDFGPLSPLTTSCEVRTPADTTPPGLLGARARHDLRQIVVFFSEPIATESVAAIPNYRIEPDAGIERAEPGAEPNTVLLSVARLQPETTYALHVRGITDAAVARNQLSATASTEFETSLLLVHYTFDETAGRIAHDAAGPAGGAKLLGPTRWEPMAGRLNGALRLDGHSGCVQGPADLNLGAGDFSLTAWVWKALPGSRVVASKGNGFGSPREWSWGWEHPAGAANIAFRSGNRYWTTAPHSLPLQQWTHIAFVREGSQGTCYVNGKSSGGTHDLSEIGDLTNPHPLRIGRRRHEPTPAWFGGMIDDLRMYARSLTADEVAKLANP